VFVGPFQPSWNQAKLEEMGITHILCIAETREQSVSSTGPILDRARSTVWLKQLFGRVDHAGICSRLNFLNVMCTLSSRCATPTTKT